MFRFFKKLFKLKDEADFKILLAGGAILVDVRTKKEFNQAHAENSINIPLDGLKEAVNRLNKNAPIITVCQSGVRSKMAKAIFKQNQFTEVYNGGNWSNFK